jgi:hypothetical protein
MARTNRAGLFGRTGRTVLMPAWYTSPSGSTPAGGPGTSSCSPCGQPLEVGVGDRLCPQGKGGFASHWGILTLQVLAPHSLVLRCSIGSGGTISSLWHHGLKVRRSKVQSSYLIGVRARPETCTCLPCRMKKAHSVLRQVRGPWKKSRFSRISLALSNPPTHTGLQIISPVERGFASHWGILTLQVLVPHSLVPRCSTGSGWTVSGLWCHGLEVRQSKVQSSDLRPWICPQLGGWIDEWPVVNLLR